MKPANPEWEKPFTLKALEEWFDSGNREFAPDATFGDQHWTLEVGDYVRVLDCNPEQRVKAGTIAIVRNRRNPYGPHASPLYRPGEYWLPLVFLEAVDGSGNNGETNQNFCEKLTTEELATLML